MYNKVMCSQKTTIKNMKYFNFPKITELYKLAMIY